MRLKVREILECAILTAGLWLVGGCSGPWGTADQQPAVAATTRTVGTTKPESASANRAVPGGIPATIHLADLPPEARETLGEIRNDPPYRFEKDGTLCQNRERDFPFGVLFA